MYTAYNQVSFSFCKLYCCSRSTEQIVTTYVQGEFSLNTYTRLVTIWIQSFINVTHRVKAVFPQSSLLLRLALSVHRLLSLQARHLYRCTHTISGCLTAGTRPPDANTHPPSQTQPRAEPYRLLPAGTFAAPACLPEDSTCRAQKPFTFNTPTTGKGCTKAALPAGPSAGHPRPPRGSRPLPLPLPAPCRAARRPPSPWPQPLPRPLSRGAGLTLLTPRPPFVERGKGGGRGL